MMHNFHCISKKARPFSAFFRQKRRQYRITFKPSVFLLHLSQPAPITYATKTHYLCNQPPVDTLYKIRGGSILSSLTILWDKIKLIDIQLIYYQQCFLYSCFGWFEKKKKRNVKSSL